MDERYDPAAVERAAQSRLDAAARLRAREDATRPKFYACSMLPYPCGKLHMGHVRNYTINDVMYAQPAHAGAQRAHADGLGCVRPAGRERGDREEDRAGEVDAREHRGHEGADAAARASPSTGRASSPPAIVDYYRWNQWLFLKMLERGIAYRKTQTVNWDPIDQTVLANEQVIDGARLALGRAGREARDPRLLPAHHAVRRRAARLRAEQARRLAARRCARCRRTGSAAATA